MTELYENRIVNGLLKADIGLMTPEEVQKRLSGDVLIVCPPSRTSKADLWPCVWLLASVIQRQFTGDVLLDVGLHEPLDAPIPLGSRCRFVDNTEEFEGTVIGLGTPNSVHTTISGDARGNRISYGTHIDSTEIADPISCCALAGYLGFAALASAAGIPVFHASFTREMIELPFSPGGLTFEEIAVLGLGQIGQAFLSLLFFNTACAGHIHLVDRDVFGDENYPTQILLAEERAAWAGEDKVEYILKIAERWGFTITKEKTEIDWGWKNKFQHAPIGFLGFDNMVARRIGVEGGFRWLIECGVGTDFCRPRVSWHSLPPDREIAKRFLLEDGPTDSTPETDFAKSLASTPGGCGKVIFENIQASAPSLGLLAAAYAVMELSNFIGGDEQIISAGAYAWSPILPLGRDIETAVDSVKETTA